MGERVLTDIFPAIASEEDTWQQGKIIPFFNFQYLGFPYLLVPRKIVIDLEVQSQKIQV